MAKKCGPRKYSDGGKVLEREYGAGKPTFLKAVGARLGMGDGYGKTKPQMTRQTLTRDTATGKTSKGPVEKIDVSNVARGGFESAMQKRKKMLDDT